MIKHYFLTELRLLTRHKTRFVLAVLLPVTFYLLFTSILDLPQPIMAKFNQEYMYNMTTFSLMSFCLFSFLLTLLTNAHADGTSDSCAHHLHPHTTSV